MSPSTLESSYLDDIDFSNVGAVPSSNQIVSGLVIDVGAADSGPYSNIVFNGSTSCGSSNSAFTCSLTACVRINTQTRGIHGITCEGHGVVGDQIPEAAIYLDGSNNTIEDVHIEGFYDGVVVGDQAKVSGNTLINISGAQGKGPLYNTVHICAGVMVTNTACSNTSSPVGDLSLFGIRSAPNNIVATPVRDDLNGVNVNSSSTNANVGMYILGEQVGSTGQQYSRFTTANVGLMQGSNPTALPVPSWGVGTSSINPGTSCNTTNNLAGSLYSNTMGSSQSTIYVCSNGVWKPIA